MGCNEMGQACRLSSVLLVLWSSGEDEDRTLSSKRVWCGAWRPPKASPPPPWRRGQPAHSTRLCQGTDTDTDPGHGHVFVCSPLTVWEWDTVPLISDAGKGGRGQSHFIPSVKHETELSFRLLEES